MDIEVKVDKECLKPKVVIYTNELTKEVSDIIDGISSINQKTLKAYKDEKMYMLEQKVVETIYAENGKVFARCNNEIYSLKNRLYELEAIINKKLFIRISKSEIVNFNMVKNIDFKIIGTLVLNFKSNNKSYVSRRYIPMIKEYLEI